MKQENQHLSIPEEESRKEKRTLWRTVGSICIAAAFVLLVFYKRTDNVFYLYPASALAVLGAVLLEKNKKESRIVRSEREIAENRVTLHKKAVLAKVYATASAERKIANWIIAIWTVLVAGIVLYAHYMHGTDYVVRNWPGPAILLAFPWIMYIVWISVVNSKEKNDAAALMSNRITVLKASVSAIHHVGRHGSIPMVSFKSELYGKHEQMVSHGCLAQQGDCYYLVLRKNKEKYKLIDLYCADGWELDEELKKYLVEEVNI